MKNKLENIPKSTKFRYIICPDMTCEGFNNPFPQCGVSKTSIELFPNDNLKMCPHLDKALKVVFCPYNHPIEQEVNGSDWKRADCREDDCFAASFARMSSTTYRIPLEYYEEFKIRKLDNHA